MSSCSQSHAPTHLYPQPFFFFFLLLPRQRLMTLQSGLGPISCARSLSSPLSRSLQMKAECIYSPACHPAASGRGITLATMNKWGLIQKQALARSVTHCHTGRGSPHYHCRGILLCGFVCVCFCLSDFSALLWGVYQTRGKKKPDSVVACSWNFFFFFFPKSSAKNVRMISAGNELFAPCWLTAVGVGAVCFHKKCLYLYEK